MRGQVLRVGPKCQPCSSALLLKAGCVFWVCDEPPRPLGVSVPGNSGNPCLPSSVLRSAALTPRAGLAALCRECQLSLRAHGFQSDPSPGRGLLLRTFLPDGGLNSVQFSLSLVSDSLLFGVYGPHKPKRQLHLLVTLLFWLGLAACISGLNTFR